MTKRIDPANIARLELDEHRRLMEAVATFDNIKIEDDFPADQQIDAYTIMLKCGLKARSFNELKLFAFQIGRQQVFIERLRTAYDNGQL